MLSWRKGWVAKIVSFPCEVVLQTLLADDKSASSSELGGSVSYKQIWREFLGYTHLYPR